jgi:hypothetical protein
MFMCMLAYVRPSPPDTMPRACIADNAMLRCIFTPYIWLSELSPEAAPPEVSACPDASSTLRSPRAFTRTDELNHRIIYRSIFSITSEKSGCSRKLKLLFRYLYFR